MVALIQRENHVANKWKTAGRYQFDTHPTRIGLRRCLIFNPKNVTIGSIVDQNKNYHLFDPYSKIAIFLTH